MMRWCRGRGRQGQDIKYPGDLETTRESQYLELAVMPPKPNMGSTSNNLPAAYTVKHSRHVDIGGGGCNVEYDIMPAEGSDFYDCSEASSSDSLSASEIFTDLGGQAPLLVTEDSRASDIYLPSPPSHEDMELRAALGPPQPSVPAANEPRAHGNAVYWEEVYIPESLAKTLPLATTDNEFTAGQFPFDPASEINPVADDWALGTEASSDSSSITTLYGGPFTLLSYDSVCKDEVLLPADHAGVKDARSPPRPPHRNGLMTFSRAADRAVYVKEVFVPTTHQSPAMRSQTLLESGMQHGQQVARAAKHPAAAGLGLRALQDDQGSEHSSIALQLAAYRYSTCTSEVHAPLSRMGDMDGTPSVASMLLDEVPDSQQQLAPAAAAERHAAYASPASAAAAFLPSADPELSQLRQGAADPATSSGGAASCSTSSDNWAVRRPPAQQRHAPGDKAFRRCNDLTRDARSAPGSRSSSPQRRTSLVIKVIPPGIAAQMASTSAGCDTMHRVDST